jgi:hypothetical protein
LPAEPFHQLEARLAPYRDLWAARPRPIGVALE